MIFRLQTGLQPPPLHVWGVHTAPVGAARVAATRPVDSEHTLLAATCPCLMDRKVSG